MSGGPEPIWGWILGTCTHMPTPSPAMEWKIPAFQELPGLSDLGGGPQLGYLYPVIWGLCSCIWTTESLWEGEIIKLNYCKNLECSKDSKHFCAVFVPGVALVKLLLGCCCPSALSLDGFPVPICASHHI